MKAVSNRFGVPLLWKTFLRTIIERKMEYTVITAKSHSAVVEHLRDSFFADEPLNKAAGLCKRGDPHAELEHLSCVTLADDMSMMAIAENKEIAGVILNGALYPGEYMNSLEKLEKSTNENFKKIFRLLYGENLKVDMFAHFNVQKIFDVRILSVGECYRGRGISKELLVQSEQLARQHGFEIMKADATGIFSQKILKSVGFKVLREKYYDQYTDEDGQQLLNVAQPHLKLQILYKKLD